MSEPSPSPASTVCPTCGAGLSEAAGGLCPRCLMAGAAEPTQVPGLGAGQAPPAREEVAAALPQFEIIEMIGAGGMGTVWRARQPKLHREVALKLLPASLAGRDPAFAERFEREGQLLARLHHPNIVTVHDSGRAGDFFYLVMELVDGVNLRQAMRASRFTPPQALAIVPKICEALQYAHEEGVLHRDIKPENILLDAKGRVKLVDFGIAKLVTQPEAEGNCGSRNAECGMSEAASGGALTSGDATLGTPNYMAPEQIDRPADVDHRADIYSLGVVFYELLTGELPVGKFAPPSQKSAADPRLDGIVRQALEKERGRRQQSVGEMRTQVETVTAAAPPCSGVRPPIWPTALLHVLIMVAVCAVFVLAVHRYRKIFEETQMRLPAATLLVCELGAVLRRSGWLLLPLVAVADLGVCIVARAEGGRPGLRRLTAAVVVGWLIFGLFAGVALQLPLSRATAQLGASPASFSPKLLQAGPTPPSAVPRLEIAGPALGFTQDQLRGWVEKRLTTEYPNDKYRSLEWGEPELIAPHDWVAIRYKFIVSFGDRPNRYFAGHRRYSFTRTGDFVRSDYVDGPEVEVTQ